MFSSAGIIISDRCGVFNNNIILCVVFQLYLLIVTLGDILT